MRTIYELLRNDETSRFNVKYFETFELGRRFLESKGYNLLLFDQREPTSSYHTSSGYKARVVVDLHEAKRYYDRFLTDAKNFNYTHLDGVHPKQARFYKNVEEFAHNSFSYLQTIDVYDNENDFVV